MARQVITTLIDDLDGSTAEETVSFGLEGVMYTIDLSGKNALKMRKLLEPYIDAGTKTGRSNTVVASRGSARPSAAASREENQLIRAWARKAGKDVSDRGRIPAEIVEEYRAAKR